MSAVRTLVVALAVVTVASANAALTLTPVPGSFSYGGGFSGLPTTPSYNNALGTSSLTVSPVTVTPFGQINGWFFTAKESSGTITQPLTYDLTLSGINANTFVFATLTAFTYSPTTGVGAELGSGSQILGTVDSITGLTSYTQLLKFAYDVTPYNVNDVEYKLNVSVYNAVPEPTSVAAMAVGVVGLMFRRRRSSK